ncbi:MAG: hypothetical protein FJZ58_07455 [Chlamydiae bacterium]|nr:hypothetical protein [Chlamydiota bacterium]
MQERLLFKERLILMLAFLWGLFLFMTSTSSENKDLGEGCQVREEQLWIEVHVVGEVQHPGFYRVLKGASVHEVLAQAGLLVSSDIRNIYRKKRLFASCQLVVPKKTEKKRKEKNPILRKISPATGALFEVRWEFQGAMAKTSLLTW